MEARKLKETVVTKVNLCKLQLVKVKLGYQ